jgi:hypothetical protein
MIKIVGEKASRILETYVKTKLLKNIQRVRRDSGKAAEEQKWRRVRMLRLRRDSGKAAEERKWRRLRMLTAWVPAVANWK